MNNRNLLGMFIVSSVFCLLTLVTGCNFKQKSLQEIAEETDEDYQIKDKQQTIVRNSNDFSFGLFKKIAENEKNKNVFVSTIGLVYSLNIINNGASGATQQEICKALKINSADVEEMNSLCRRMIIGQAKKKMYGYSGPSANLRTASLLVTGKEADINNSFINVLKHDYFGSIMKDDNEQKLQQRIDKWCAEQTEGMISSLPLESIGPKSVNLLVANYFFGNWKIEFDKHDTKKEPFKDGTSSMVNMMNQYVEDCYYYAKFDDFSLLKIPYVGGYYFIIILPNKTDGLVPLLQSLDGKKIRSAFKQLKKNYIVYLKLPKFEVKYSFSATDYLTSLGIKRAFSGLAEFDKIQSEPMVINGIKQVAKIILNEEATRAASVTDIELAVLAEKKKPTEVYFYADHPFAYIIEDPFGNYCFMGTFWGDIEH